MAKKKNMDDSLKPEEKKTNKAKETVSENEAEEVLAEVVSADEVKDSSDKEPEEAPAEVVEETPAEETPAEEVAPAPVSEAPVEEAPVEEAPDEEVQAEVVEEVKLPAVIEDVSTVEEISTVEEKTAADTKESGSAKTSKEQKREQREQKRNAVMTTGQFLRAFILLLIPGINIICVLLWALGAAKNKNRIHFSRACIAFFLIEILLVAIITGVSYIYLDVKQNEIIKWADARTNGVFSFFEVDDLKDLDNFRELPDVLKEVKEKEEEEEKTTEPIEIPKVNYVYNPDGISSFEDFKTLWNAEFNTEPTTQADSEPTTQAVPEPTSQAVEPVTEVAKPGSKGLMDILKDNNVDVEESHIVFIIIDNEKENCIISFDPTGKLQSYPSVQMNDEIIYIGGTK